MINILLLFNLFRLFIFDINYDYINTSINVSIDNFKSEYIKYNSYKNESIDEIAKKLNKYLNSTLKNKGKYIAKYSISKGVDPYLATAIILHETGCEWKCSKLVRNCNNVGGNKGKPSCNGGSYRKFDTIEDGIKFAINTLSKYYKNGKTTPEQIGPKYASDPKWPTRVNNYIKKLKNG
jgi:hypothetical protein